MTASDYIPLDTLKTHKKCTMCKKELPIENFALCDKYGGRRGKCKPCQTEHEQRSKGTWDEYQKEQAYREELHLLQKEGKRRCRMCSEVKSLDDFPNDSSKKVFYNKKSYCKKCAYEVWRKPRDQTLEAKRKKSIQDKKYRSKLEVIERLNERSMERYYNDVEYRLRMVIRNRINKHLKRTNQKKLDSYIDHLGCTTEQLIEHIESQFKPGMTWENHSQFGWHLDHIKPLCSFNLEDSEQFKEACHYTNLQPLWWKENLSKNGRINYYD